jgi:exosortase A-associated hydrolase 1
VTFTEHAVSFGCAGETLIGILALPQSSEQRSATGIVVVVGGPQYRAGSHRQFTLLARAVAAAGYPVLRFDYRGMGDSTGAPRDFESVEEDMAAAIGAMLQYQQSVTRVILWGLCDGASAALLYLRATRDSRVSAVCIANPWVRSETSLARTHMKHYYFQRVMQLEFWRKAFGGQVTKRAVSELWRNLVASFARSDRAPRGVVAQAHRAVPFQRRMAEAAVEFDGDILVVTSGRDLTAKEFQDSAREDSAWRLALAKPTCERLEFPDADHTFSGTDDRRGLQVAMVNWLDRQRQR